MLGTHQLKTEFLAALTTFSTMVYIVFLNPQILSAAGMDVGAVMTATIIASAIATLMMGLLANYPFALAPGMGLNVYFAYTLVVEQGHTWQVALGICFIAGLIFCLLTVTGFRSAIMHAIPPSLRLGTLAGIGLFLCRIGLENIGHGPLTLFGCCLMGTLLWFNIRGALFFGIVTNWALGLALGLTEWEGLVSMPPSIAPVFLQLDLRGAFSISLIPVILSFVLVALFDAAGTLMSLAMQGKFLDSEGRLPNAQKALTADAIGITVGALLGTSTLTTYLESATGIRAGGRTGVTSCFVALFFLLTLFFSPFVASLPLFATAPALIVIGLSMVMPAKELMTTPRSEALAALSLGLAIPLSYSIATGLAVGFICYPLIKLVTGEGRQVPWLIWVSAVLFSLKFWAAV